jgi:hypothetical protein
MLGLRLAKQQLPNNNHRQQPLRLSKQQPRLPNTQAGFGMRRRTIGFQIQIILLISDASVKQLIESVEEYQYR